MPFLPNLLVLDYYEYNSISVVSPLLYINIVDDYPFAEIDVQMDLDSS